MWGHNVCFYCTSLEYWKQTAQTQIWLLLKEQFDQSLFYNEHSGGCRRQPSTPAEGGCRAKLVCRYRVYHLSEAIKLKTRRPPAGFLVLQSRHSHTCKLGGTSAFSPHRILRLVYISIFPCCFLHAIIRVTVSKESYFLIFWKILYFNFFYMYHIN